MFIGHFSLEDHDKWLNDAALLSFFQHINTPVSGVESLAESVEPEIIEEYRSFVSGRHIYSQILI
jgi:hypothetical protein